MYVDEVEGVGLLVDEFCHRFLTPGRPVVIRGGAGAAPALSWTPHQVATTLSPRRRLQSVSSRDVAGHAEYLTTIPYPDDFMPPLKARHARLDGDANSVVSGDSGYVFWKVDRMSHFASALARGLNWPAVLPSLFRARGRVMLQQFAFGQSGTGAPWHWHQDAFNVCLAGERIWYFLPPARALMSYKPVAMGVPAADEAYFAVQRPGDIVFVPEFWAHSVVNRVLSAAVALEVCTTRPRQPLTGREVVRRHARSLT